MNKKLGIFLAIVIVVGGVWYLLLISSNIQPKNTSYDCANLPAEKREISLDFLKQNTKLSVGIPKFSEKDINNILTQIQPHIQAIQGYSYTKINVDIRALDDKPRIEIYVRARTGEKINKCPNQILSREPSNGVLRDYCTTDYDDFSFYMSYSQQPDGSFIFSDFRSVEQLKTDIPSNVATCAMALLERDKGFIDFKGIYGEVSWGLSGWGADNVGPTEPSFVIGNVISSMNNVGEFTFRTFIIDPWSRVVKFISEEKRQILY